MPDTKDFHGVKNILLDNEDWMVVDPLDYNSFVYYAPENMKSKWDDYRDGDTYFIIDKNDQLKNELQKTEMQNEKKGNENLKELKDEILRLNKKNDFLILNLNQIHSKHNKLSI
jgi:hypothetical protein